MSSGLKIVLAVLVLILIALVIILIVSLPGGKEPEPIETPSPSLSASITPEPPAITGPTAAPSPSETPAENPSPSPAESEEPSPSPTPDDTLPSRDDTGSLSFQVDGQTVTESARLVSADFGTGIRGYGYNIYCLADDYDYQVRNGADLYYSTQMDNCWLELHYVSGKTVESALPAFLDDYLQYTEISYTGDYSLNAGLYTQGAVASDGNITYEAFLADADSGILSFVLCYPNDAAADQAPRLHAMLDSFEFNY